MKKPSIKCLFCDRVFVSKSTNPMSINRLKANLANHMKGSHPEHYQPKAKPEMSAKDKSIASSFNKAGIPVYTDLDAVPLKRPYERKAKSISHSSVNFCPKCGCNIRAVNVAVGL